MHLDDPVPDIVNSYAMCKLVCQSMSMNFPSLSER